MRSGFVAEDDRVYDIVLYHQPEPIQKIIDECVQNLHIPLSA